MGRSLLLLVIITLILKEPTFAQQIPTQPVVPGLWIKSWLICGPIPIKQPEDPAEAYNHLVGYQTDYLVSAGGEIGRAHV